MLNTTSLRFIQHPGQQREQYVRGYKKGTTGSTFESSPEKPSYQSHQKEASISSTNWQGKKNLKASKTPFTQKYTRSPYNLVKSHSVQISSNPKFSKTYPSEYQEKSRKINPASMTNFGSLRKKPSGIRKNRVKFTQPV